MFARALLVIASGFIFIFSPGLPMNLISRYDPDYKRNLVYWGIGGWIIATFLSLFINNNLLIEVLYDRNGFSGYSGQPLDFVHIFARSIISSILLGYLMRTILKNRIKIESFFKRIFNALKGGSNQAVEPDKSGDLIPDGLALGFGAGLIAHVFTGILMVGAGFQVLFGNISANITVEAIASSNALLLFASIITLILFRIALLAVSAVQGVLTAGSTAGKSGKFWIGVITMALFNALILSIQLLMGGLDAGQVSVGITPAPISIVTGLYYLAVFVSAFYWLVRTLQGDNI